MTELRGYHHLKMTVWRDDATGRHYFQFDGENRRKPLVDYSVIEQHYQDHEIDIEEAPQLGMDRIVRTICEEAHQ